MGLKFDPVTNTWVDDKETLGGQVWRRGTTSRQPSPKPTAEGLDAFYTDTPLPPPVATPIMDKLKNIGTSKTLRPNYMNKPFSENPNIIGSLLAPPRRNWNDPYFSNTAPKVTPEAPIDPFAFEGQQAQKDTSNVQQTPYGAMTPEQEEKMRKELTNQFVINKSLETNPEAQKEEFYKNKNQDLQEPVVSRAPSPSTPPAPQEDPEVAFQKRQRLMKFLSGSNDALKKIGAGMQGLAGKNVVKPQLGGDAFAEESKTMANQLSPSQRAYFSKIFGSELPENFTKDRLEELLKGKKLDSEMKDKLFNREMAIKADTRAEIGEVRRKTESDENQLALKQNRERLDASTTEHLTQKRLLLDAIDATEKIHNKNPGETGPIIGRLNQLISKWGNSAPEIAEMNAALSQLLSVYGKSMSGAAISALEFGRFKEALPNMINPGETFNTLLKRFRRQAENDYRISVGSQKATGRNTSEFEQPGVDYSLWNKVESNGDKEAVGPNGETGTLPSSTDLTQYPGWKWR